MIYQNVGNDMAGLDYRHDPLADKIAPDYPKLNMAAWGIPELDDIDQFKADMADNVDTVPNEHSQYVANFADLTSQAEKFRKLGVDITKPSLNPQENAAHMAWQASWNDNIKLGQQLQQSKKFRDKASVDAAKKDVWTNPVPDEILKGLDDIDYSPDRASLDQLVKSRSGKRDLLYQMGDVQKAVQEEDTGMQAIDQWAANVPPAFKQQALREAELAKASFKSPFYDQYKHDYLSYQKQKQAQDLGFKYATLDAKGNEVPSDFTDIVMDLINGNKQGLGRNLAGVKVGEFYGQIGDKVEKLDDVIKNTYTVTGKDLKSKMGIGMVKSDIGGSSHAPSDNDVYIVIEKTSTDEPRKIIRVKHSDGTIDKQGLQALSAYQSFYDKQQVTPTTDFVYDDNGNPIVNPQKSFKTFSKPNTTTHKANNSVKTHTTTNGLPIFK